MERLDVELASEFILVAATLMRIKSKMLLPRPQLDDLGNEIDPREELVRHLLEYKKYKSVIDSFHKLEETELMRLRATGFGAEGEGDDGRFGGEVFQMRVKHSEESIHVPRG